MTRTVEAVVGHSVASLAQKRFAELDFIISVFFYV
jgi:hypothetical protein